MRKNELVPTPCVILHENCHSERFTNAANRAGYTDIRQPIGN
jgi:hypothetical protein